MSTKLILGTSQADFIEFGYESSNGNSLDNVFGDFVVQAGRGNDTISIGYGDDTVYGGTGENVISTSYGDDVIYTGRHSTNVYAGDGHDSVYADLSKGADHTIDLGSSDYDSDMLHLENVSLDRASALTVNNFKTTKFSESSDTLYIDGQLVDFTNLASGLSLSQDENRNAILSFGDDDTITFEGVPRDDLLAGFRDYEIFGTSGDDYVDAAYVDEDGETLANVDNVDLGDGNDFIELIDNQSYLRVTLGSGADTLSVSKSSVQIDDLSPEDTILIDGEKLTWSLIDSKGYITFEEEPDVFFVHPEDGEFEIFSHSISLVDYLGERSVTGQVDGTSGDDMILASYRDVEGEMVSDGADIVNAGDGNDVVQAGRGNDTISTGYGDDTVHGSSGENVISTYFGDDVIYTGRHSTSVDAGYGRDSVYADLSKGADHTIDLGSWDYDSDMLHLENVSLARASALTVKNFQTDEFSKYSDTLYIDGQLVDFTNLASGLSLSQDENRNAVLSFGDDDTVTFAGVSTNELLGILPDYVLTGTSGDDYVDAAYVDEDGEMFADVYSVELGDGNDFIEFIDNHSWLSVYLGSGADTLSVDKSSVHIEDFAAEDTILIDGEKLTWALIDSKGYDTHDGNGYFSVQSYDDDFEIFSYSSISLKDYLGERGVIGQVDGTSGDDMILASYSDVDGEMVSDDADIVKAGDGNDVVKSYFGNDTVFGGDGDDSIYGDRGNNQLFGEAGNDVIGSGRHQSTLSGGDGDDLLIADMQKGGDHVLNGGDGMDTFDLRYAATSKVSDIIIQDFDPMSDSLVIDKQIIDLGALPEGAMLADNDNGTALLTLVTGDTVLLEGHSTNDLLGILEPNGEVNGTDMSDKIDRMFADKDGEMVGDTNDLVIGGGGRDTIYGYRGDDTIYGNSGKDELYGMTGHNHLFGGTGDDVIYSGRHSSVLDGGDGNDVLNADLSKGGDHVITGGKGLDVFNLTDASSTKEASTTLTDFNVEQDTLVIFDQIIDLQNLPDDMSIRANDDGDAVLHFNDNETVTLQGISLDDLGMEPEKPTTVGIVDGTNGDDLIDDTYVDADGDMLTDGNDTIDAGAGDDEVITGRGSNVIYGGDGDDLLGSTRGSSEIYGEAGDDVLVAMRHTSLLDGGAGDDILAADLSKGADHTLTGGDGNDQFVLGLVSIEKASHITITDFDAANETLYIEEELVDFDDLVSGLSLSDNEDGNAVLTFGDDDTATFMGVSSQDLIDANPMADLFIPMTDDELAEEDADQVADIFLM